MTYRKPIKHEGPKKSDKSQFVILKNMRGSVKNWRIHCVLKNVKFADVCMAVWQEYWCLRLISWNYLKQDSILFFQTSHVQIPKCSVCSFWNLYCLSSGIQLSRYEHKIRNKMASSQFETALMAASANRKAINLNLKSWKFARRNGLRHGNVVVGPINDWGGRLTRVSAKKMGDLLFGQQRGDRCNDVAV